jgi:hypothetical protein
MKLTLTQGAAWALEVLQMFEPGIEDDDSDRAEFSATISKDTFYAAVHQLENALKDETGKP